MRGLMRGFVIALLFLVMVAMFPVGAGAQCADGVCVVPERSILVAPPARQPVQAVVRAVVVVQPVRRAVCVVRQVQPVRRVAKAALRPVGRVVCRLRSR